MKVVGALFGLIPLVVALGGALFAMQYCAPRFDSSRAPGLDQDPGLEAAVRLQGDGHETPPTASSSRTARIQQQDLQAAPSASDGQPSEPVASSPESSQPLQAEKAPECALERYEVAGVTNETPQYLLRINAAGGRVFSGFYKNPGANYALRLCEDGQGTFTLDSRKNLTGMWYIVGDCDGTPKLHRDDRPLLVLKVTSSERHPSDVGTLMGWYPYFGGGGIDIDGMIKQ
jgi:hypothetical protein